MTFNEALAVLALDAKVPGLVKWDTVSLARITVAIETAAKAA